ncbi:MAG: VOC family protein [Dehalococcoidia bacterium]|nr:VOC family protein [Dehalococcoidia bacterium]
MWIRLRQIALIVNDADAVAKLASDVFGLEVAFEDPHLPAAFGLQNRLLPVGTQFLELCAPVRENTAGGRYLDRRGGDGGYMVICQVDDHPPRKARVQELGIRVVAARDTDTYCLMQLHPQDTGGSFLEMDWHAGPDADPPLWTHAIEGDWWTKVHTDRVRAIVAAEIQDPEPEQLAARWSAIIQEPVAKDDAGNATIRIDNATLRFVPCSDGRPSGLGGIDLAATDAAAVRAAAAKAGVLGDDGVIMLGGVRVRLV